MDDALVGGTVSAIMLDEWEDATLGYGRQYMKVPPLSLLCDVLLDFGDVRRMSERRQSLEFSERLCRLAGRPLGLHRINNQEDREHRDATTILISCLDLPGENNAR